MKKVLLVFLVCLAILAHSGCTDQTQGSNNVTTENQAQVTTVVANEDTSGTTVLADETTVALQTTATDTKSSTPTQSSKVTQTTTKTSTTTATTTTKSTTATTGKTTKSSEGVLKILNIGNSFGHNATSYLADVAAANGKTIEVVNLFKSGCSLEQHWKGYQEDLAQYWYELNGTMFQGSSVTLKSVLDDEEWDIIVTHASPTEAAKITYQATLKKLVDAVKKHCPTAKYYVMQTWALGDTSIYFNDYTGSSRIEMWSKIESASKLASTTTRLPMIPCGIAANELENWFEANYPSLSFYAEDDLHAADTWGWYLLSLVWYQTLTGEVPNDKFTEFNSPYTNDPVIRAKVHEIARAAVATYAK